MNIPALLPIAASAISLVLSLWLFLASGTNQRLQGELQQKQEELQTEQQAVQLQQQQVQAQQEQINAGLKLAQEVGPAVLKDLGTLALQNKNDAIKKLLSKHGISIQEKEGASAPASTPKPANP